MMKKLAFTAALVCCGILCASPYGRALQKARETANRPHPAAKHLQPPKPGPKPGPRPVPRPLPPPPPVKHHQFTASEFNKIWFQMGSVISANRGALPGPAGAAGLRKICGPGQVSPELLKINDFAKLTERNCDWAYVGGAVGVLRSLPKGGDFPVLFSKPYSPRHNKIRILTADGKMREMEVYHARSCAEVITALRKSSRHAKHPVWNKLSIAASQIDRASR